VPKSMKIYLNLSKLRIGYRRLFSGHDVVETELLLDLITASQLVL